LAVLLREGDGYRGGVRLTVAGYNALDQAQTGNRWNST
jgi:hypothetical protein